jgi:hypothetical protein
LKKQTPYLEQKVEPFSHYPPLRKKGRVLKKSRTLTSKILGQMMFQTVKKITICRVKSQGGGMR